VGQNYFSSIPEPEFLALVKKMQSKAPINYIETKLNPNRQVVQNGQAKISVPFYLIVVVLKRKKGTEYKFIMIKRG